MFYEPPGASELSFFGSLDIENVKGGVLGQSPKQAGTLPNEMRQRWTRAKAQKDNTVAKSKFFDSEA